MSVRLVDQLNSLVNDVRQGINSQRPEQYDGEAVYNACITFHSDRARYGSGENFPTNPYVRDLLFQHWLKDSIPPAVLNLVKASDRASPPDLLFPVSKNEGHAPFSNGLAGDSTQFLKRKWTTSISTDTQPDVPNFDPVDPSPTAKSPPFPTSYLAQPLRDGDMLCLPADWHHLIGDDGYISEQALKGPVNVKCYHGCGQSFKTWISAAEHMGWLPKNFPGAERHGILSPDAFLTTQHICSKMPAVYACPLSKHLGVTDCPFDWSNNGSNYLHGQNPKANWRTAVRSEILYHTLIGDLGFTCRCGLRFPSPYHAACHLLFGYCTGRPLTMLEWSLIAVKAPGQGTEKDFLPTILPSLNPTPHPISSHFKVWKQGIVNQTILCSQRPQNDPVGVYIDRHSSSTARSNWQRDTLDIVQSHHRAFKSNETVLRMHVKDLASAYAMFHPNQPGFSKLVGLGPFSHPLHSKADRMRLRWALVMSCAAWDFLRSRPPAERVVIMSQDSWTLCPALLAGVCAVEDFRIHISITLGDVKNALAEHEVQ